MANLNIFHLNVYFRRTNLNIFSTNKSDKKKKKKKSDQEEDKKSAPPFNVTILECNLF